MSSFILSLLLLTSGMASPKIYMEAGESETIDIPSESSVEVNPKKILEIEAAGKGKLRLIAIKSGVVLIKASSPQGEKSWLVEVLGRDQQSDWLLRSEWQSYFCSKDGIHCDLENKVISGESDDLEWFYEARQTCKKKMPCSWQVVISEAARTKALRDIKPILGGLSFDVTADGQVLIDSYCDDADKKVMDKALANLNESFKILAQIRCLERAPDVYLLDVLVVAERKGSGEISNPLQWERIEVPSKQPLHAFIAELSQNSRLRVVAQPELSLSMGGTAMLRDGQEIQTHAIQKDTEEILWKTSGFRLDLKLIEIKAGLARIQMKMNLSQPQAGLRTIDASEFQTEVWIPSHALQRVGRMQATLEGQEENRIPWLSAIPLLGALFRWESVTDSKSQIDIFLRIRPASIEPLENQAD
ncbi:MAG: hypothetical protein EOP07_14420 [Proteobacteria bacterium]|nr:MAG: hypothetical protein EOP07_14420 [Pseudomonadota bacterium]